MAAMSLCTGDLWDSNLTWYTDQPDFTPCFHKTVLVYIPCLFLCLITPGELYLNYTSKLKGIPWSWINITKLISGKLLCILSLIELIVNCTIEENGSEANKAEIADYLGPCVKFVTYLTSILLLLASKNSGRVTSGPQFFFWITLSVCQSFTTSSIIIHKQIGFNESTVEGLVCVLSFLLILLNLVLQFFADTRPAYTGIEEQPANRSSEFESSFVSRLLFFWFDSTIWKNRNKTLTLSDLWDLHPQDSVWTLGPMWERLWNRALEKNKKKLNKSGIIPVLIQGFNSTFIKGAFLQLVFVLSQFLNPLLLNLIINFIQEDGPIWKGIFYTIMLSVTALIIAVSDSHYWFNVYRSGLQIKTCLSAAMFKKSLKLSSASRRERTAGEIVNLISVDSPKLSIAYAFVNNVWAAPLQAGLSIFFLYKTIGVSIFAGLGILCVLFPVNSIAWYVMEKNQSAQMTKKDKRVRLISEILNGIKVIKLFSWEFSFIKRINKLREEEVDKLRVIQILEGTQYFVWCSAPILMALASFLTFALIDPVNNILDTHTAFVTLTLFNTLRAPLFMLPFGIASLIQGAVSVKRINSFLNLEELDPDSVSHSEDCTDSVVLDDATFKWNANISEQTILNNVTLRVPKGKLIAIVGRVGSGKSSLLSALLGEMVRVGGNANVNGKIAYVPQQAWMRNATLKNNILFRKNFYKEKYDKVIEACALKPDLEILTGGDETEIGEKGINLSGGQKQRISLARAVYNNADIYLLDDPLSAVDSHVGKHLFEKVIGPKGALSKKTRILVTHGISFLPMVDQIAVMKDGQISELGTYDELLSSRGAFAEFLMEQVEEQDVLSTLSESERADMWQRLEETLGPENLHSPRKLNQNEQMFFGRSKTTSVCSNYESAAQSEYGNVALIFEPSRWLRQHSQDYGLTPRSPQPSATQGQTQVKTEDNSGLKNSGEFQVGRDLIEDEFAESNGVKFEIYLYYAKAIGLSITTIGVLLYALCQVFNIGGSIWLSIWAGDEAAKHSIAIRNKYLMVYAAMSLSQSVAILMAVIVISFCTLRASVKLHKDLLEHLLMSTMAFFDTTPLGRIINRFSKDIDEVDLMIPSYIKELLTDVFSVIGTLLLVCYASPIVIILVVPLIIMFYFIQKWYLTVSRQLKRMINVTSSPINSSLTESFQGVSSIRAYKLEESFIKENYEYIEQNQKCAFPEVASRQWLFNRLEILANLLVVFTSLMAVIYRDSIDPGLVGFSLTYIFSFQLDLYLMTKYSSELEKSIVSVERIREYQQTPTEAAFEIHDTNPGPHWPEHGSIEFDNYGTRYRDGLDLVLKGISFKVASGEKVGIVGRTGAGKSSLTLALFRMVEGVQGCIKIDGIDISKLGLSTLRSAITIIPQDPVLFTGTLRFNLDPFHRYSDQALWQTLEHAHLKNFAMQLSNGLDHEVSEGGENLSVGQRQLVCLARALLKKTKVLILDEATAAVDLETDDLIQATIRDEFKDCTVLTIAHRLKTILDNDKILVLDSGKVKEFDEPEKLLKNKKTIFYSLAKDAGIILT